MPERELHDADAGAVPTHENVQQLIEAARGRGAQGVKRTWQASDSNKVVLISDATGVRISADNGTTAPSRVVVTSMLNDILPPGAIWPFAGGFAPAGWLLCNGQAVSRTTYAPLFAAIGTAYGAGDGAGDGGSTFNVPNLSGRVVLGVSDTHGLTETGGAPSVAGPAHTHPGSHSHGLNGHTHGQNGHTHGQNGHTHDLTAHAHGLNSHIHATDISHGHTASAGGGTGTTDHVVVGAVTDPNHVRDSHGHVITVNGTGSVSIASGVSGTPNTATSGSIATGVPSTPDTQGPSTPNTQGPSPATTIVDSTAASADYGATTVPTLPPFLVLTYIIRTGV